MDRIKRLSVEILEKYRSLFSSDFEENKENLGRVAMIRSKQLRNQIAGYITAVMRSSGEGVEEASGEAEAKGG